MNPSSQGEEWRQCWSGCQLAMGHEGPHDYGWRWLRDEQSLVDPEQNQYAVIDSEEMFELVDYLNAERRQKAALEQENAALRERKLHLDSMDAYTDALIRAEESESRAKAAEEEREQWKQLAELNEANTRAQQERADDYLERIGGERDRLRALAKLADQQAEYLQKFLPEGVSMSVWEKAWLRSYEALAEQEVKQ